MKIGHTVRYALIVMMIMAIFGSLAATAERGTKPRNDPGLYYRVAWKGRGHTSWMSLENARNALSTMWRATGDIKCYHGETKQRLLFIIPLPPKKGFWEK
jgi:hypothetical protein